MISREEVLKLAALARLELSEREIVQMREDLNQMLEYVSQLEELELEGVAPFQHGRVTIEGLRSDEVTESLPVEEALANAPEKSDDHFRVPRVLKR